MMKRKRNTKTVSAKGPVNKKSRPTREKKVAVEEEELPTVMGALRIKVVYWYKPKFTKLKTALEQRFPNTLEIIGEKTPSRTGWFEVTIEDGPDTKLVHSKKDGDGQVDKPEKLEKIVLAIEAALAHAKKKDEAEAN